MPDIVKRIGIGALIGLAVGLLVAIGTNIDGFFLKTLLDGYENRSYDARMRARLGDWEESSIDSVVIIDIEQNSIETLGNYKDWPHAYHGQLIDVVSSGNPKAILFDIIFDPENTFNYELVKTLISENPPRDEDLASVAEQFLVANDPTRFIESTRTSEKVYHALVFEESDTALFLYPMESEPEGYDYRNHLIDIPEEQARRLPTAERIGNTDVALLSAAKRTGSANFPQDDDGIIRRAPTAIFFKGPNHVYPSLTMAATMDILGIPTDGFDYDFDDHLLRLSDTTGTVIREIPIDDQGRMFVNYYGYFKTFYYLPYVYCFDPEMLPPEYWENKIAIVGSSLPGLMDLRNTPVQETFAGVEIHANVINSLMNNEFVRLTSETTNFWVILIIGLLFGLSINLPAKPIYSLPIPIIGALGWVVFTYSQFFTQLVMWEVIRPVLTVGITYLGIFLYNFIVVEKDKRFLRSTFSTYISPELIEQMYEEKQEPKLGGDSGIKTAYFTDIQSFSSFSEVLSATQLVELLNEYLTAMTDVLLEQSGTLDKYEGDAIVAFFGAPIHMEDHAYRACIVALNMQKELAQLRKKWAGEGDKWPELVHHMRMRIGINSGEIVTGNMGSRTRMNYTMMGDVVNTAARLEASAKQYGIYIQMTKATLDMAGPEHFEVREIDRVRVVGKTEAVESFELMALKGELNSRLVEMREIYNEGLALYRKQEWDKAKRAFAEAEKLEEVFTNRPTNPSRVYLERCDFFKANPPGDDWDGVWTLKSK
ncbi:MAG: adenylate/guanylate cyclase domain-containing protein [FCB group bacterium]|nr:adenylate/guanylate cyclase domain-containing protein [FCB group bacterium]